MHDAHANAPGPLPSPAWCYGCGYNLAGLAPEGVCPECGLAIAASWPVWDLRACHEVYVRHVRGELWWMRWAAALAGLSALAAALAVGADALAGRWNGAGDAGTLALVVAVLALLAATGPLGAFERRWRRHPEPGKRMAGPPRRLARVGWGAVAVGVGLFALPGGFLAGLAPRAGLALGLVGLVIIAAGAGAVTFAAMRYGRLVLERAGRPVPPRWHDAAWVALPLAGPVLALPALAGVPPWWCAAAAVPLGVAAAMGALVWRCKRASGALTPW
jgi:hypothetical protein